MLTALLKQVNLAGLPEATEYLLARVESSAAVSADVRHLMDALPELAEVARYGDVRGTRAERILPVIETLFARILIGLPGACASLDDEAAAAMVDSIENVQGTIKTLDRGDMRAEWLTVLRQRADTDSVHGLVRGRCCRLLLEQRALDEAELQRLARLALSPVVPADQATAWVEGVLRGRRPAAATAGWALARPRRLAGRPEAGHICGVAPPATPRLLQLRAAGATEDGRKSSSSVQSGAGGRGERCAGGEPAASRSGTAGAGAGSRRGAGRR